MNKYEPIKKDVEIPPRPTVKPISHRGGGLKNNGWIKCSEKLPELKRRFDLLQRSDVVLVWGKQEYDDDYSMFAAYMIGFNRFYSCDGECYQITHWQELPEPPIY